MKALINTEAFNRLREIRFLGGIDYFLVHSPNGSEGSTRYTRYQHSLGVAWLAMIYAEERGLAPKERALIIAAALLHDIGHCPLSHTLEPVFKQQFGQEHHSVTEQIIEGKIEIGHEVANVLNEHRVDISQLLYLLSGRDTSFDQFFSGPINFDTVEGILRSWIYVQYERRFPAPDTVLLSAIRRASIDDRRNVDEFWSYKDRAYRYLIRSPRGVIADHLCEQALLTDLALVGPQDFVTTERALFNKCPTLRRLIKGAPNWGALEQVIDSPIRYQARYFQIDNEGDFFNREDKVRYKQAKEDHIIAPGAISVLATDSRHLFYD